jgi:hypothetical protein
MDASLMEWVQWYAAQRGTTVTQLIKDHFMALRRNYENRKRTDVEQI